MERAVTEEKKRLPAQFGTRGLVHCVVFFFSQRGIWNSATKTLHCVIVKMSYYIVPIERKKTTLTRT